jgi:hypothetical protein
LWGIKRKRKSRAILDFLFHVGQVWNLHFNIGQTKKKFDQVINASIIFEIINLFM